MTGLGRCCIKNRFRVLRADHKVKRTAHRTFSRGLHLGLSTVVALVEAGERHKEPKTSREKNEECGSDALTP